MRNLYILLLSICAFSISVYSDTHTSAASGNWNNGATWSGGVIPQTGDDIVILLGHLITLDVEMSIHHLTINPGDWDESYTVFTNTGLIVNQNLTITGNVTMINGDQYGELYNASELIKFNGTSQQTVAGFVGNGWSGACYDIEIDNPSGVDFIDNGCIFLSHTITITNGMVTSGSIELAEGATIVGERPSNYIQSNVYMYYSTVGTGSCSFGNMGLSIASGSQDIGSVRLMRSYGSLYNSIGIYVYWRLEITTPTGWPETRTVTLKWLSDQDGGLADLTKARVFRSTDFGDTFTDLNGSNQDGSSRTISASFRAMSYSYPYEVLTVSSESQPLPVELTSFAANISNNNVVLGWNTTTEMKNYGFEVERRRIIESLSSGVVDWAKVGFVNGAGTSNVPKEYSYSDVKLPFGRYEYRLKQIDLDGSYKYSQSLEIEISGPKEFVLNQNYPNPFNPSTVISYRLSVSSFVTLNVYDILGREVATLVNEVKEPGNYEVQFNASKLSSGLYFYRLEGGQGTIVKNLLLLK